MNVNIYNKNNEAEAIDESIFEESLKRKSYRWSGGVIVKAQKDVTVYWDIVASRSRLQSDVTKTSCNPP